RAHTKVSALTAHTSTEPTSHARGVGRLGVAWAQQVTATMRQRLCAPAAAEVNRYRVAVGDR
ncbi:MAG: hypothetical protein WCG47_18575, partial [Dermatophilaceae bacterium]